MELVSENIYSIHFSRGDMCSFLRTERIPTVVSGKEEPTPTIIIPITIGEIS